MARMGRPTNRSKHQFEEILESPSGIAKFKRIMAATKDEDTFLAYFKEAIDRAYGKALQEMSLDVNDTTPRPTAEELDIALRSLRDSQNGNGVAESQ